MPKSRKKSRAPQAQKKQPGIEAEMKPKPESKPLDSKRAGKLQDKVAIITGGDSGIGRAVATLFAQEGADVCIMYLEEHTDARATAQAVEKYGRTSLLIAGDIGNETFCKESVRDVITKFGKVDILVNNAAWQEKNDDIESITREQIEKTFATNIFSQFYMTQAVLPHLKEGAVIINTASVTAYRGSAHLLAYSSTKGAIVSFTRSLSEALVSKGIRVNAVAPGPVWTPLIPSTFSAEEVAKFGTDNPMGRAAEPNEIAPCFLFLASTDSSYITGQVLHPNGGEIING